MVSEKLNFWGMGITLTVRKRRPAAKRQALATVCPILRRFEGTSPTG